MADDPLEWMFDIGDGGGGGGGGVGGGGGGGSPRLAASDFGLATEPLAVAVTTTPNPASPTSIGFGGGAATTTTNAAAALATAAYDEDVELANLLKPPSPVAASVAEQPEMSQARKQMYNWSLRLSELSSRLANNPELAARVLRPIDEVLAEYRSHCPFLIWTYPRTDIDPGSSGTPIFACVRGFEQPPDLRSGGRSKMQYPAPNLIEPVIEYPIGSCCTYSIRNLNRLLNLYPDFCSTAGQVEKFQEAQSVAGLPESERLKAEQFFRREPTYANLCANLWVYQPQNIVCTYRMANNNLAPEIPLQYFADPLRLNLFERQNGLAVSLHAAAEQTVAASFFAEDFPLTINIAALFPMRDQSLVDLHATLQCNDDDVRQKARTAAGVKTTCIGTENELGECTMQRHLLSRPEYYIENPDAIIKSRGGTLAANTLAKTQPLIFAAAVNTCSVLTPPGAKPAPYGLAIMARSVQSQSPTRTPVYEVEAHRRYLVFDEASGQYGWEPDVEWDYFVPLVSNHGKPIGTTSDIQNFTRSGDFRPYTLAREPQPVDLPCLTETRVLADGRRQVQVVVYTLAQCPKSFAESDFVTMTSRREFGTSTPNRTLVYISQYDPANPPFGASRCKSESILAAESGNAARFRAAAAAAAERKRKRSAASGGGGGGGGGDDDDVEQQV